MDANLQKQLNEQKKHKQHGIRFPFVDWWVLERLQIEHQHNTGRKISISDIIRSMVEDKLAPLRDKYEDQLKDMVI